MKNRERIKIGKAACLVSVALLACMVVNAASVADEIRALKDEIKSNSVTRSARDSRYYMAWYRDLCTEAEREAILERNIAAHRRWMELVGEKGSAVPRAELGKVLEIGGRWSEAEKELSAAIATGGLSGEALASARWSLAECLWNRGDKEGAKKVVSDIAAMTWPSGNPPRVWSKAMYMHRAWTDPDGDIDSLSMPHDVAGRPFPTPQDAKYGEKRVSLKKVEIKFRTNETSVTDEVSPGSPARPVSPGDPIVRLLKKKLARFGAKFENGGTKIEIVISSDAPVAKPQGYSLDIANGKVSIKARDRIGATWGVVSLIQCVDRGDASAAECAIRDWPKLERRGVIEGFWYPEFLEFALFHKMSSLVIMFERPDCAFIFSALERERIRIVTERYSDFGIEWFWSSREISVSPVLPLSAPRTRALHLQWFRWAAEMGANICFEMDDDRFFDFPEVDKKAFGTATNMDSKYMTGLYREVKKDFPKFRLMFGTPFYYGPDGATGDPEPREPYLKSHKEFLDPEIDVYWSGPRVKSIAFTVPKIKWMTDLIGRKPVVYHNSDCVWRHSHCQYGADVPNYKGSHCPETLDLIGAFYVMMTHLPETCKVGPAMDWCWNPDAHDAEAATRRTVEQIEGPGVFEIIAEATLSISYFDKYTYGRPRSELMTEDPEDLDRRVEDAEDAWKRVLAIAKNDGRFVFGFKYMAIHWAKRLAGYRRNPPKWLLEQVEAEKSNTLFAKTEVGFDADKGDIFIPCEILSGGTYHRGIDDASGRAACGAKELVFGESLSGKFTLDNFPPERTPKLIVVAQAFVEAWDKPFKVDLPNAEVAVNGNVVWSGKMFPEGLFKPCEIDLPGDALRRDNVFTVKFTGPAVEHQRRPMIHYVVIRK